MHRSPTVMQLHRLVAAQTLPGRWRLSFGVCWRRQLWHWPTASGRIGKRFFDMVVSALVLLLCSPLFVIIMLLIKFGDGGPAIFTQTRVGRFGSEFKMYKFRSMCLDAEAGLQQLLEKNHHKEGITFKIKDDPRLTRIGKWLRKFSLDELPQFFNVLRGDMSLVGPRPPLPREVMCYSLADRRRLVTKPGITCLWQIGGRSEIDFSGQVKLDVQYIESQSFVADLEILARTV